MTKEITRPLPRTWWLTRPGYFQFMMRELTSLAVLAYAALLIWGLWSATDPASFSSFWAFLTTPLSVWLHVLVLILALYHTGTWIALTPKVLVLWRDDDRVEPDVIAGANGMLFVAITGVVLWLVLG